MSDAHEADFEAGDVEALAGLIAVAPTTECPHCGRTAKDCDDAKARGWGNCCIRCDAGGRVDTHRLRAIIRNIPPVTDDGGSR